MDARGPSGPGEKERIAHPINSVWGSSGHGVAAARAVADLGAAGLSAQDPAAAEAARRMRALHRRGPSAPSCPLYRIRWAWTTLQMQ